MPDREPIPPEPDRPAAKRFAMRWPILIAVWLVGLVIWALYLAVLAYLLLVIF